MLVFGVVFKSAPGGFFAGSWVDFSRFGRDLGMVLGGFWVILGCSGLFLVIRTFVDDFWKVLTCFGLL